MLHGFTDGHHLHSELSVSSEITRISDIVSVISFGVSLISIFGFGRYKQQYRARYSRDVFQAKASKSRQLEGEDYVHIIIDLFTLSFELSKFQTSKRLFFDTCFRDWCMLITLNVQ